MSQSQQCSASLDEHFAGLVLAVKQLGLTFSCETAFKALVEFTEGIRLSHDYARHEPAGDGPGQAMADAGLEVLRTRSQNGPLLGAFTERMANALASLDQKFVAGDARNDAARPAGQPSATVPTEPDVKGGYAGLTAAQKRRFN